MLVLGPLKDYVNKHLLKLWLLDNLNKLKNKLKNPMNIYLQWSDWWKDWKLTRSNPFENFTPKLKWPLSNLLFFFSQWSLWTRVVMRRKLIMVCMMTYIKEGKLHARAFGDGWGPTKNKNDTKGFFFVLFCLKRKWLLLMSHLWFMGSCLHSFWYKNMDWFWSYIYRM